MKVKTEIRYIARAKHESAEGVKCKAVLSMLAVPDEIPVLAECGGGWYRDSRLMEVRWLGVCPECDTPVLMTAKPVKGRYSASQECTARCQNATGFDCECQCAGRMHGGAHDAA